MDIPFIDGAYRDRSLNMNAQVCQNLYIEVDKQGGKSVLSFTGSPGLTGWLNVGVQTSAGVSKYLVGLARNLRFSGSI